jgi:transposase InsO family protein
MEPYYQPYRNPAAKSHAKNKQGEQQHIPDIVRVVLGAAWPRTLTFAPILLAQPLLHGDMSHEAVDAQAAEFDRARGSSLFGLGVPSEAAIVPHDDSAGAYISWWFRQAIPGI